MWSLDDVLELLERHYQRATYGAVGRVVGKPARSLMHGRPRDHRHSWIVGRETGRPSGYAGDEMHPALFARGRVIAAGDELERWLEARRPAGRPAGHAAALPHTHHAGA